MNPHFPDDLPDDFNMPAHVDSPLPRIFQMIRNLDQDEVVMLGQFVNSITRTSEFDPRAELVNQLSVAQTLQAETMTSRNNATQKASALRTVNAVLKQLTDMESQVYNISAMKAMEEALRLTFAGREDGKALLDTFKGHYLRLKPS